MRCPKCHYLSFDPEPRCKNCGYDLEVADTDLALRTAESQRTSASEDAPPDLTLRDHSSSSAPITLEFTHYGSESPRSQPSQAAAPSRLLLVDESEPTIPFRAPRTATTTTTDLPLFVKGIPPSAPPVSPRSPLGVRRAAPEQARARKPQPERRLGPLDRDLLEDLRRVEREEVAYSRAEVRETSGMNDESPLHIPASERVAAAAVDLAVLGSIAGFVLWATVRLCGVSLVGLGAGALVPLAVFLILVDLGYLLMFTAAGGQTVGKMLMDIRVVSSSPDGDHVSLGQAAARSVLTVVSVISLGLSWLPALLGNGPALHDRLAHTRVVRA